MGVGTSAIQHNIPNSMFKNTAHRLGIHVQDIPQNTAGKSHPCGYCNLGCRYGEKQGSLVCFL